ncbi:MAG: DUF255 domain-containing protein [Planctomycetaceae bacterium]|nr:DUF255 domain-containing protein [Planctomycetaceae bacterium]
MDDRCRSLATLGLFLCLSVGCSLEGRPAYSDDGGGDAPPKTVPATGSPAADNARHPANRLARESSPYLLLHAHNPVDWYPWGPEALEKAKRENKPIFLSIGYSSCFWCHVMEREVFENEAIAKYMNQHFVNIKVDREERPDLDDIYMTALQVYFQAAGSAQGGGWPLSIFLTPDGHPIAGGTYFPPRDMPGRPGFPTVMSKIHEVWTNQEADIRKAGALLAAEVQRVMKPGVSIEPVPLTRNLVDAAIAACLLQYDAEYGGLDFNPQQPDKPKFPVPSRLMLLQAQAGRPDANPQAIAALDKTLDAMAAGGIYDHLGGGFHRYSTDRLWRVPHFEKMLYDNAQLGGVYAHAYKRTNRKGYRRTSEETLAFILGEMTDPAGGFYSALDAETDGVEGACYVWSPAEIRKVLGDDDARVFSAVYGLDQPEFFEHGYVLHLPRSLDETSETLQLPLAQLQARLAAMQKKLLDTRRARPALLKDDKVLTSWSGLAISALAEAGQLLDQPDYIAAAEKGALFIAAEMRDADGRLQRSWRNGEAKIEAYLDDYAFLIQGLLSLHAATQDEKWLHAARRLMDIQVELFWDPQEKGFFFTSHRHEQLLARTKDAYDSVLPSGNSVSARNLVRLAVLTEDPRYKEYATDTLQVFAPILKRSPGNLPYLALALQEYLDAYGESARVGSQPAAVAQTPPKPGSVPTSPAPSPPAANNSAEKLLPLVVQDDDPSGQHKARATVYLGADKLTAGQPTPVAVVIEIAKGWHLNANPPRPDYVIPTELSVESTLETRLDQIHYPDGHDFRVEGIDEPLLVYEDRVILHAQLTAPAAAAGKTDELVFTLRYQACNDQTCSRPLTIKLPAKGPVAGAGETPQVLNRSLFRQGE